MAKKKVVAKRIKKIDVKHDFEDIISMAMFSYDFPEEKKQGPEPKFKKGDKVKVVGGSNTVYVVHKVIGEIDFEYIIHNTLPVSQIKTRHELKKQLKENEIEKAP